MISVVLPVFNEEKNIGFVIDNILSFFAKANQVCEIIAVNDGSSDRTGEILDGYKAKENVKIISHPKNLGYGAALRSGFKASQGDLIFFMDSDRQFNIRNINSFLEKISGCDFVVGYRQTRQDPKNRILYAKIFHIVVKIFFGIKLKDIDCAFKLFKKDAIKNMNLESSGALINLEIFIQAKKKGFSFIELPVQHFSRTEGRQTGGSFMVISKATFNLFRLWFRNLDARF